MGHSSILVRSEIVTQLLNFIKLSSKPTPCVLLTLTNYGPASHNIKFLRSLAEEQDRRLVDAFPRDQHGNEPRSTPSTKLTSKPVIRSISRSARKRLCGSGSELDICSIS
ncbi:hypothetical protein AGR1B_pAt30061 [Agrobacterium fabacearum S56]|nr:hypothetical protein AGR1B_pAt30061 [Agrobacterium fabacearum S56]